jgi:hypothetical protein
VTFRLISAKGMDDDLAAGRITASEQSLYLLASFLIWLIPAYLFLFPAPRTNEPQFFWGLWLIELACLILICSVGIGFCLQKCRVDPTRNFLVDFSCLNAPISLTTLTLVWGGFYLVTEIVFPVLSGITFDQEPSPGSRWFASSRMYDVIRMLASLAQYSLCF